VEDVSLKLLPPDSIGPSAIENPPTPNDVKGNNNKGEQAQSNMDISITENQVWVSF
jgi:hypothetical protein